MRHRRHSALLVARSDVRIMIDCGADWVGAARLYRAHRDRAYACPCRPCRRPCSGRALPSLCYQRDAAVTAPPSYSRFIRDRREMPLNKSVTIGGLRFKAYRVQHSIRAPAVGYRVSAKAGCFFYLPDVAGLPNASAALRGIDLFIGDGATIRRSMVRMKAGTLIGHAPMTAQLDWCAKAHVRRAIFTHCGSPIVCGDPTALGATIQDLGRERGIDTCVASDGDRLRFIER